MNCQCNPRRQLVDCLARGVIVIEIIQPLPVQAPVKGGTDVGAGKPKFDVIHLIDHRVLGVFQPTIGRQRTRRKLTLIIERVTLTEPKMALALETSFARFKASMAAFNADIAPSRPFKFGRWDSTSMVETRGRDRTV